MPELPENSWLRMFRVVLGEVVVLSLRRMTEGLTSDQFTDIFLEKRKELESIVENEVLSERLRITEIIRKKKVPVESMSHDLKGKCDFEKNNTIDEILKDI